MNDMLSLFHLRDYHSVLRFSQGRRLEIMQRVLLMTLAAAVMTTGAFAESRVNRRRENQQDRIAQGVKSGELTARETARLERQETQINKEIRADRAANGGHLTKLEKKDINNQQNRESRRIYRAKHN
jgi:hypothetical protein